MRPCDNRKANFFLIVKSITCNCRGSEFCQENSSNQTLQKLHVSAFQLQRILLSIWAKKNHLLRAHRHTKTIIVHVMMLDIYELYNNYYFVSCSGVDDRSLCWTKIFVQLQITVAFNFYGPELEFSHIWITVLSVILAQFGLLVKLRTLSPPPLPPISPRPFYH